MFLYRAFYTTILFSFSVFCFAQSKLDSTLMLKEVLVVATHYREVIPSQKLSGETLKSLNSFSVADAIRYFSGVQIKDYGGIGGLKTVDMRSMGTNHMGIFYDGIQLGNAQNGQIDLGKFSLDNIEEISLYNGQKSEIFQSAKDFSASGTVYLHSRKPRFTETQQDHLKTSLKGGSFDLLNPSVLWEHKLSNKLSTSFNTEYIYSSGRYKFRYKRVLQDGKTAYDTTAIRQNGDIHAFRAEAGIYGTIDKGFWNTKLYFYDSERGIPGAIVNNIWKRSQRQWDRNVFLQSSWQKSITKSYNLMVNIKYANDFMRYLNPDTTLLHIDNSFWQQEIYASMANKYSILKNWDIDLSGDFQWNTLNSNMNGFVRPTRLTTLIAAASAISWTHFKIQGSLLATIVNERVDRGNTLTTDTVSSAPNKRKLSPAVFLSYKPFINIPLRFRAFYKHIFRMPTFNDLYYTDIGNISLKPEYTHQYNLGFYYSKEYKGWIKSWQAQADAYYNQVTDKIVAVPKGNGMYRWMMMNLGTVEIRGIDVSTSSLIALSKNLFANVKLSYTYQKAQDFTKRKSEELQKITYGGQIPYIPWHNGSAIVGLMYKDWRLNYSFIYVGERYHNSANIPENYEQPWYTHDMSVAKTFTYEKWIGKVSLEINNLLSQDYEVVLNYPMPKRNYKLAVSFEI
ncbi:MAG: TonB-dependent receptor [Paludibacteraceae bacterium]